MAEPLHPAATHHLPSFITAPGETDWLMVVMAVILALSVLLLGVLFFWLHSLPERMAHKSQKLQLEVVAVLCLISLFTHMHIFWIAGLLLALIDLPDFGTPLGRIATSAEKIAGIEPSKDTLQEIPETLAPTSPLGKEVEASLEADESVKKAPSEPPTKPEPAKPRQKERAHA
jgi:NADH:ubiquinone oxidoreductase subunit 5 (subunit L)/multisubunit Na+/H+ antiporter MnhA subunit